MPPSAHRQGETAVAAVAEAVAGTPQTRYRQSPCRKDTRPRQRRRSGWCLPASPDAARCRQLSIREDWDPQRATRFAICPRDHLHAATPRCVPSKRLPCGTKRKLQVCMKQAKVPASRPRRPFFAVKSFQYSNSVRCVYVVLWLTLRCCDHDLGLSTLLGLGLHSTSSQNHRHLQKQSSL